VLRFLRPFFPREMKLQLMQKQKSTTNQVDTHKNKRISPIPPMIAYS
jgi:hypothetical protein